jgi:hypothetical protein
VLNVPWAWKYFQAHPMVRLGDMGQVKAHCTPFVGCVNLAEDGCMVCAERIIGSEIILGTSNGTPR